MTLPFIPERRAGQREPLGESMAALRILGTRGTEEGCRLISIDQPPPRRCPDPPLAGNEHFNEMLINKVKDMNIDTAKQSTTPQPEKPSQ